MISIRRALPQDVGIVAGLSRQTFYDTYHRHNTVANMQMFLTNYFSDESIAAELSDEMFVFYIAKYNDAPVGYIKLSIKNNFPRLENALEISRIYCLQKFHGKGIGAALLNACFHFAEGTKKNIVWLGVWEKNENAIAFYTRHGFEKFGEQRFILGHDIQNDWLMKKELG